MIKKLLLQLFGEGGGAAAAPAGSDGGGAGSAEGATGSIEVGMAEDGTRIDQRLAERMKEQEKRFPGLYKGLKQAKPAQAPAQQEAQPAAKAPAEEQDPAQDLEAEWNEAKNGKFKALYGRDVANSVQDRFKNQKNANDQLTQLAPMLNILAKKAGVEPTDFKGIVDSVMNDESLYEEEAEKAGMTNEAYRTFQQLQAENERFHQQEQERERINSINNHLANLARQGEELKQKFPNFDLNEEMKNNDFRRMTAPYSGLTVEQAYLALHYNELLPGAVQAGVNQATKRMSQSLAANAARPVEGAMSNTAAVQIETDPSKMTKEQIQQYIERARMGERITSF